MDIENLSLTEEALIVVMNWSAITSTYSSGGVTADKINNTPELYIVTSLLSLSSVIFKISGLDLISTRLKGNILQATHKIGMIYGNIVLASELCPIVQNQDNTERENVKDI